jgi:hypothetical protein
MLCLPYYGYIFSSTKLVIRANRTSQELKVGGGKRVGEGIKGEK